MRRKRKGKKRLVHLLVYLVTVLFWLGLAGVVVFLPPRNGLIVAGFLALFFLAIWLTGWSLWEQARWASLVAFWGTGLLILQLFRQLHWLNLILLSACSLALFFGWKDRD